MNKYDVRTKEIGMRIRNERERLKLSQQSLLSKIFKSESSGKTLRAWENGERLPDLDSLARMAEIFGCDIGYLLCDYDERNRENADIVMATGLSESAVNNIKEVYDQPNDRAIQRQGRPYKIQVLSSILQDDRLDELLRLVQSAKEIQYWSEHPPGPGIYTGDDYYAARKCAEKCGSVILKYSDAAQFKNRQAANLFERIIAETI